MSQARARIDDGAPDITAPPVGAARPGAASFGFGALARVSRRYARWVGQRSVVTWVDRHGRLVDPADVIRALEPAARGGRPLVVAYWIADTLVLATLPFSGHVAQAVLETVTVLVDTTTAGRATGLFLDGVGAHHRVLPPPGDPQRLQQLLDVMARRESCAIAADGGGPYRTVGTGLVSLAMTLDAIVVPVAARASRTMTFTPHSRVKVPLPGCRVVVAIGERQSVTRDVSRREHALRLRTRLDELGETVERVVRHGAP